MTARWRRSAWAVPGAVLLSLALAGQALAFAWSAPIPLTSSGSGFGFGIAAVNNTTAVAVYVEWNGSWYDIKVKRSTTSGSSWSGPITLSTDGYSPDVAALDPFVDVVWESNGRVRYARSVNGGVSYSPSIPLSPSGKFPINLSVARGPTGLVIVAWQNGNTNNILTRVSTDGGVTFGAADVFASNIQDMGTSVAAGEGVVYLAYKTEYWELVVRYSNDGGVSWTSPSQMTANGYGVVDQFDITAQGTHAYLAYTVRNKYYPAWGSVKYRRSLNSGASWSAQRVLSPPRWKTWFPEITLQDGVVRAAYGRRVSGIYYQQSTDGLNWSMAEQVASDAHDPYVTKTNNVIVLYEVGTGDAYVKTGS